MSGWFWLGYILVEVLEVGLLSDEFFGFKLRKGWKCFAGIFIAVAFLTGIYVAGLPNFICHILCAILILYVFFEGKLGRKFQFACIAYLLINFVDVLILGIALFIKPPAQLPASDGYNMMCSVVGCVVWLLLYAFSKIRKWELAKFLQEWLGWQLSLLIAGLLVMGLFIGSVQSFIYDMMDASGQKASLLLCLLSVFFIMIVYGILAKNISKRRNLEEIIRLDNQYMELQKKYYEKSIEKYKELQSYRHDIKNHIQIISRFCEDKKFADLTEYVRRLDGDYAATSSIHTGNSIVDCLLAEMLDSFKEDDTLELSILGRLPEMLSLENVDICILFSNAFRNAEEALKKQTGRKCFHMQIRQNAEEIFVQISNSITKSDIDISVTDKSDKEMHGYGTVNMKKVVAKYHGEIHWKTEREMMHVDIYLPHRSSVEICQSFPVDE